ncbi:MAG: FAD:protein FMN transferase [Sphaerochaetaceae bacterium]|nr:FAD:protein FMN transferase [Sphaerochaetaceae bacterium]
MKIKLLVLLLVSVLLTGCSQKKSHDLFAMETHMSITCYGYQAEKACQAAIEEIQRLDNLLSIGKEDSEVSVLNANGKGRLSKDTKVLLDYSLSMWKETDKAFDVTIYPLMELWGFTSKDFIVPSQAEIEETLEKVGSDKLEYNEKTGELLLAPGQKLDFGGIAKGYTSDCLKEVFSRYRIKGAIVSLGGNVQVYGEKPDHTPWRCGIQDPFANYGENSVLGIVTVDNEAVITSGAYERFFTDKQGRLYHHILDTKTGHPAMSDLVSVTIVSESGIQADVLSTSCFILGLDKSAELWRNSDKSYNMILMAGDGTVYITAPLENRFRTDRPLRIIN